MSFRVDDLLRQLEVEFAPLAQEKRLALTFMPCSLTVRSDRRLLRRLLENLVSNAIKYTPSGRVLVGCRRQGEHVRIVVCDTGIGIPRSKRDDIFKEFHRLDQGAKVARGLGLGLSIVERIARMLGRRVEVVSEVGRGSQFSVQVPLSAPLPASIAPAGAVAVDRGRLAGTTALCIDNDQSILDGMATLLAGWGCRVLTAHDLATAEATLADSGIDPDVVLIDYHLDAGNGIAAVMALRQRCGRDLPAILITADRGPRVRDEAVAGGIQVLNKPVKPAALRALLARCRVQRAAAE